MGYRVTPTVRIDGRTVACTPEAVESAPVAVDGLKFHWGRSDYHDAKAEPASLTMWLIDATGEWARHIRTRRAIGMKVDVRWTATPTSTGVAPPPITMFRGRVQIAKAEPVELQSVTGVQHWKITLTCADRAADMGNAISAGNWPRETMLARAIRLRELGLAGGSEINHVRFWNPFFEVGAKPVEARGKSALDLMGDFYRSMSNEVWAYDPDSNEIKQVIRLSQPYSIHLGSFDDDRGAVVPVPDDITVDGVHYPAVALNGCEIASPRTIELDAAASINRVEVTWKDELREHQDSLMTRELIQPGDARRVMRYDTWIDEFMHVDGSTEQAWRRVQEEGSRPRHPEIRSTPTFEFATLRLAKWTLQTWENTRPAYIAGSLPYQWLLGDAQDYMPVVAPIGGTTTFDPTTGWQVEWRVHWIHNQSEPSRPATWASLIQKKTTTQTPEAPWWYAALGRPAPRPVTVGKRTPERDLTWGSPDGSGYRFGKSVTWGDMKNVPFTGTQIIDHLD